MKLLARHDPHAALFDAYAATVAAPCRRRRGGHPGGAARLRAGAAARRSACCPTSRPRPPRAARSARHGATASSPTPAWSRPRARPKRRSAARHWLALQAALAASDLGALQRVAARRAGRAAAAPAGAASLSSRHFAAAHAPGDERSAGARPMNPLLTTGLDARRPLTALSVNVNKVALLRNKRALAIPSVVAPGDDRARGRRARHHRPSAARRAPHPRRRRARARRAAEGLAAGRVQHRGQPVPQPDGASCASCGRSSAPSCPTASSSRPPTTAGTSPPTPTRLRAADRRGARARRARQPVHGRRSRRRWRAAQAIGADRVELYTEPYAAGLRHAAPGAGRSRASPPRRAAAQRVGLGVNAGHDLNRDNLAAFLRARARRARGLDRPRPDRRRARARHRRDRARLPPRHRARVGAMIYGIGTDICDVRRIRAVAGAARRPLRRARARRRTSSPSSPRAARAVRRARRALPGDALLRQGSVLARRSAWACACR